MSIKDFAEKFIKAENDAFQKGDFTALAKLEDPYVVYHMYQLPAEVVGHEAHKQDIIRSQQGVSFTKLEFQYLTGEGNLFALSYKAHYISTGKVPGFPPAGKEITSDSLFLFRLKNGRIIEAWINGTTTGLDLSALSGK